MTARFARDQRVEVTRTTLGVVTYDLGTVVDSPTEEAVRVRLDHPTGRSGCVYDAADVRDIPEAVSRHITALIRALGGVTPAEEPEVLVELVERVLYHGRDLIAFAREVQGGVVELLGEVSSC